MKPVALFNSVVKWIRELILSPRIALMICEPVFRLFGFRRMPKITNISSAKKILIVRLDEIGDMILTTPFLRELRKNAPDAWITLVVRQQVHNLVELCPYVNEVLTFESKKRIQLVNVTRYCNALQYAVSNLWKYKFDLAFFPRWDFDGYYGSFLIYFSGANKRVAYSECVSSDKQQQNRGYDKLFTDLITGISLKHEVERNLEMIKFLGGSISSDNLELWTDEKDENFGKEIIKRYGVKNDETLVCLCIGARDPRRKWPLERFSELGLWLNEQYGARIFFMGDAKEKILGEALQKDLGDSAINLIGLTTLRQASTLMKFCKIYIGSDSGLKHIAATVNIPVVEISPYSHISLPAEQCVPYRFKPWKTKYAQLVPKEPVASCRYGCTSLEPHCILQITVEEVKKAVQGLLR
ncbi:MAG: glycosyltransferase family 9 protein [Candidatus Omnitrophica bacterium]|nr:glycosyltransferase family 9 protein [Candidatus Omnitrophota bacterium]